VCEFQEAVTILFLGCDHFSVGRVCLTFGPINSVVLNFIRDVF